MLRQLRSAEKIKKIIWIGLLLIVIPSFVAFYGWNSYSNTQGARPMTAAKVKFGLFDTAEVDQPDMQRAEQMLRGQYASYGRNHNMQLDPATVEKLAGPREILDQAINLEILRHYAKEHGIVVTPQDAVDELARSIPQEQRPQLDMYLRQQGMSFGQYLERTQDAMLMQRVRDSLAAQARVTHYEAWVDYQLKNERLIADFARFDTADFTTSVTVDDNELQSFFKQNIAKYRVPDQVKYAYVLVTREDLKTSLTITDDQVTSYYQEHQEDFRSPRTATVRQIMVKKPNARDAGTTSAEALTSATEVARVKAEDIYQRIVKGEDFATLANEFNEETRTPPREDAETTATDNNTTAGGMLGTVSEARMKSFYGDEWTSAVFNIKPGAVTQPIETQRGFFIVKPESIKEGLVPPLDKVRAQAEEKLRAELVEPLFEEVGERLRHVAENEGTGLQKLAQETSRTVQTTEKVDRRADFVPGIGLLGEFKEAVQDLQKGGRSDVMSDQARHLVMEVQEEFPAHDPSLDEVRTQVVQAYKEKKGREMAKAAAEKVKGAAKDLESLRTAVVEAGTTLTRTRPFTRSEAATVLGPVQDFVNASAGARKGSVSMNVLGDPENPQGYIVWSLETVTEPSRAEFAKQLGKLSQELENNKREVLLQEFLRDQRKKLSDNIEISKAYR
jgi:peptidyl-prolyl cis-trans isomerase D